MGICNATTKTKTKEIKSNSMKPDEEKASENLKKETRRTSSEGTISRYKGKQNESKIDEKGYNNNNNNNNNTDNNKSGNKEDLKPLSTIEKIINQTEPKPLSEEELLFEFNIPKREVDDLYFINEFPISATDNYSIDSDYDHIIHNKNIENKIGLSSMLLSLKERRWNKESIAFSDMIKDNRIKFNTNAFFKYLKGRILLQEHFNWLVWALSYYYYCAFYGQNAKPFTIRDKTLPFLDSVEWLHGFEWKGLFVRVQSKDKSSNLFKEMKGLKYAYCEYIQIIQSYNCNQQQNKKDAKDTSLPLLSNELIFPLMGYGEFCGLILYATPCIKKYSYEEEGGGGAGLELFEEKNVFDLTNNKARSSFFSNNNTILIPSLSSQKSLNKIMNNKPLHQRTPLNKPKLGINDISRIEKNSIYSLNISQNNINNDICLKNYSLNDLCTSKILSKIKEKNLLKVLDDLTDNTTNKEKFKYMLINASDLLPNLFEMGDSSNSELNFISFDNNTKRNHMYDYNRNNISTKLNKTPIELIENEFKMKINLKTTKTTEAKFEGLHIKIIYNKESKRNDSNKDKGNIKEDNDTINIKKQFASKIIQLPFIQHPPLINKIKSLPNAFSSIPEIQPLQIEISNENVIQYQLLNPLKQCYSLIRQISNDNSIDDELHNAYLSKSNYLNYFNAFWKKMDSCYSSIRTIHHLKREMKKYGINSALLVFALPLIQSKVLSTLIKIALLTKAIKSFVDYHESSNLMIKFLLYEINHSISVLRDPGFDCLSNMNTLKDIRKEKIFYLIKSILSPSDITNSNTNYTNIACTDSFHKYVEFIMEQLCFFIFINRIKLKRIDELMGFNLLKNSPMIYEPKSLLKEFIQASRTVPFALLSAVEEKLSIVIDPFIKFKSSIALEAFNEDFKLCHLTINEPMVHAFINPKDISSLLLVKSLCLSQLSLSTTNDDNSFRPKLNSNKESLINAPQYLQTKVNIEDYIRDLSEEYRFDNKGSIRNSNSQKNNNTANINAQAINHILIDNISIFSKNTNKSSFKIETKRETYAKLNWKAIKANIHYPLEPIVYKMKYQYQQIQYDTYLKPNYSNCTLDNINEWKASVESLLLGITSCNAQIEEAILKCYYILFIIYFYVDDDVALAKSLLMKIKEVIRGMKLYSYNHCAIVNLLEGLACDKYVESEVYFSKSLIFALFQYGEPKGRRMSGHPFYMFPLWKLARQTCILESQSTNEHFKELFHAQDYNSKLEENNEASVSNYFNRQVNYTTSNNNQYHSSQTKPTDKNKGNKKEKHKKEEMDNDKQHNHKLTNSFNSFNDDLNEMPSFNENYINSNNNENSKKDYSLSEDNIDELAHLVIKAFVFPPTSDTKTSYNKDFHCNEYVSFILQIIMQMDNDDAIHMSDEYLSSIDIKPFSDEIDLNNTVKSIASPKLSNKGRGGNQVLSHYLFEELMKKLSYRANCPDGTIISMGKNTYMETCHDYYKMISLPRVLYKLKDVKIDSIYSGWEHSIAIDNKGNCLSWGRNHFGQCGVGVGDIIEKPTQILFGSPTKIKDISCGNEHSLALNDQGVMYSFGNFEDGVLGIDTKNNQYTPIKIPLKDSIVSISSGTLHNIALSAEGKVYTWGSTKGGQLGFSQLYFNTHPDYIESVPNPTLVPDFHSRIIKIASGEAHSLALTEKGQVYSWGFGSNGQLGLGFCEDSFEPGTGMVKSRILTPQLISSLPDIIDIQSGKTFSMFISNRRELFACGVNDLKQLGIEEDPEKSHLYHKEMKCYDIVRPIPIECFLNMKVKKISCGEGHCIALIQDLMNQLENVWTWGNNHFGQLGIGNQIKSSLPKPLACMMDFKKSYIADISCGGFHSLILLKRKKRYDEHQEYEEVIEKIIDRIII